MKLSPHDGYRHPRFIARVRIAVGVWLLILAAILCGSGSWWGVLLLAPSALHFYLAYRVLHGLKS
jgi:hypothetical protein